MPTHGTSNPYAFAYAWCVRPLIGVPEKTFQNNCNAFSTLFVHIINVLNSKYSYSAPVVNDAVKLAVLPIIRVHGGPSIPLQ